ncbi:hypothetical protein [Paraburkholderia fungorum]
MTIRLCAPRGVIRMKRRIAFISTYGTTPVLALTRSSAADTIDLHLDRDRPRSAALDVQVGAMELDLEDGSVLVTGALARALRGHCEGIARAFAREGGQPRRVAYSADSLAAVAEEIVSTLRYHVAPLGESTIKKGNHV